MSTHSQHKRLATWIFGSISFLVLLWIIFLGPDELSPLKYNVLGILCGILCGLFGYFFTGTMQLTTKGHLSKWGKVGIKAAGGTALFVFILLFWYSSASPIKVKHIKAIRETLEDVQDSQATIQTILVKLEKELEIKNDQIEFLQDHINHLEKRTPSAKAKELAAKIPPNVNEYALALKAIAEERYEDARGLLDTATEKKEAELNKIYMARLRTEIYSGRYLTAQAWVDKILIFVKEPGELPADTLNELASAMFDGGRYKEAEPLYRRALEIRERVLGSEHPSTLSSVNNLAGLLRATGRYEEAEPLYRRALEIRERVLGSEHPSTLSSVNNLAGLLRATGRYEEAEPLYRRALETSERVLGSEYPSTLSSVNNLALLLYATGRYEEAEPLYRRALEIRERVLGSEHPSTLISVNNLALLLYATGRYEEAETLSRKAVDGALKVLGKEHPHTKIFSQVLEAIVEKRKQKK